MVIAHSFFNDSLSDSAIYLCRSSVWNWLAVHVIYSVIFSGSINGVLYCISVALNFRELYGNPSVHYHQRFEGHELQLAMTRSYRRFKLFVVQLIVLALFYVLAAYYYKSIVSSTPTRWLSVARWIIEATFDVQYISVIIPPLRRIPSSETELNNCCTVRMNILFIIKMNQFVMMRYAEFHPHACVNIIRAMAFHFFCPKLDGYPPESMFAVCVFPNEYLPDFRK